MDLPDSAGSERNMNTGATDGGRGEDCGIVNVKGMVQVYTYGGKGGSASGGSNGDSGTGGGGYPRSSVLVVGGAGRRTVETTRMVVEAIPVVMDNTAIEKRSMVTLVRLFRRMHGVQEQGTLLRDLVLIVTERKFLLLQRLILEDKVEM